MYFADFGLNLLEGLYIVTESNLAGKRDVIEAFLAAEIKGWTENMADPQEGAQLAVDVYGKSLGLDIPTQLAGNKAQNALIQDAYTQQHGLLRMDPAKIDQTVTSLAHLGTPIPASTFTNEVLDSLK